MNKRIAWRNCKILKFQNSSVKFWEIPQFQNSPVNFLEIPKFQSSKIPKFQIPKIQNSKIPKFQKIQNSKIPKFRNSKIPKFQNSKKIKSVFWNSNSQFTFGILEIPEIDWIFLEFWNFGISKKMTGFFGILEFWLEIPKFQSSKIPKFQNSKIPKFRNSKIPKFQKNPVNFLEFQ